MSVAKEVQALEVLTADEARALTEEIKTSAMGLLDMVKQAYDRRADAALGYEGWAAYCAAELAGVRVDVTDRAEAVLDLRQHGMSTRAIGAALGVGATTIRRDLATAPNGAFGDRVRGLDGKDRPATRPVGARSVETAAEELSILSYSADGDDPAADPVQGAAPESPAPGPDGAAAGAEFGDAGPGVTPSDCLCEQCGGQVDPEQYAGGYMRCEDCDPDGDHFSVAFPQGRGDCVACPGADGTTTSAEMADQGTAAVGVAAAAAATDSVTTDVAVEDAQSATRSPAAVSSSLGNRPALPPDGPAKSGSPSIPAVNPSGLSASGSGGRGVTGALRAYVAADPDVQQAQYLKRFWSAMTAAGDLLKFDPERIADDSLALERLGQMAHDLAKYATRVSRARAQLRVLPGGKS